MQTARDSLLINISSPRTLLDLYQACLLGTTSKASSDVLLRGSTPLLAVSYNLAETLRLSIQSLGRSRLQPTTVVGLELRVEFLAKEDHQAVQRWDPRSSLARRGAGDRFRLLLRHPKA